MMTENPPKTPRVADRKMLELFQFLEELVPDKEVRDKICKKIDELLELRGALKDMSSK